MATVNNPVRVVFSLLGSTGFHTGVAYAIKGKLIIRRKMKTLGKTVFQNFTWLQ